MNNPAPREKLWIRGDRCLRRGFDYSRADPLLLELAALRSLRIEPEDEPFPVRRVGHNLGSDELARELDALAILHAAPGGPVGDQVRNAVESDDTDLEQLVLLIGNFGAMRDPADDRDRRTLDFILLDRETNRRPDHDQNESRHNR